MIAFVVHVNGERVCSVELSPANTRSVNLAWIGSSEEDIFLHVGGADENDEQHVRWAVPKVKVGDEITIKIERDVSVDPPTLRKSVEELEEWTRNLRPGEGQS